MENKKYNFKRIGMNEIEIIKELFVGVFTIEPWNDDWSNREQLNLYLFDLVGQSNLFFASPFWTKLQNIFGHCCKSILDKVAKHWLALNRPAV